MVKIDYIYKVNVPLVHLLFVTIPIIRHYLLLYYPEVSRITSENFMKISL